MGTLHQWPGRLEDDEPGDDGVDYFAQIGVGPNQDVDQMDDGTKAGLRDAAIDGWIMLNQYPANPPSSYLVTNGWVYPPPDNGRAGHYNDFMLRASGQPLRGVDLPVQGPAGCPRLCLFHGYDKGYDKGLTSNINSAINFSSTRKTTNPERD